MKDFFKFMFASMLGFILVGIIVFFLFFAFVAAMISLSKPEEVTVNDNSALYMNLDYEINDRTSNDPLKYYVSHESFKIRPGLNDILKNLEKAKRDENIKGIYMRLSDVPSGLATVREIRNAIKDFKTSGKFVYTYGNIYTQKAYYLASVADKVFLNPEGFIDFRGFRGQTVFIKGLLDKLEIEPQIIRHGKYKSAVEPLILQEMSDANKEQTLAFISSLWDNTVQEISESRDLSPEILNTIADNLSAQDPENAYNLRIVDSLIYMDQFLAILGDDLGVDHVKNENLVSMVDYTRVKDSKIIKSRSKNKIAVIYASGDIVQGEGDEEIIGSEKMSRAIRNARLDDDVKAVVLRVNSPGGDGLASDVILREVKLTSEKKPIVVSMGNLAASGGYYISCGADRIIANPTTITGSIGVFGVIPNFGKFFNDKLGVTFDGVNTNENSEFISVTKPLTDFQEQIIKGLIERFYDTFIGHVAEGRSMSKEAVDEIGQGRVWSGADALRLGLVDEFGGLDRSIDVAKELAGLEDYRIVDLPERKDPFDQLIEDLLGQTRMSWLKSELGDQYRYFKYFKTMTNINGIQARMPFEIEIN